LIESAEDLEQVVIGGDNGVPIFVRQVADVKIGDAFRTAALGQGRAQRRWAGWWSRATA
jgi:Cu/Ag efflux pump CusA